jgi:LuxR family transcriptional regulator, quorum-sensing system regulator CciR
VSRMSQLSDVQAFIDRAARVTSLGELKGLMADISSEMGFNHFALVQHVDVSNRSENGALWLENYPSSWAQVFVERRLYASDPSSSPLDRHMWVSPGRAFPT